MSRDNVLFMAAFFLLISNLAWAAPGDLDTSFGAPDGFVLFNRGTDAIGDDVVIQTDGKIVVAGDDADAVIVLRYHPDGSLDDTFGSSGVATYATPDHKEGRSVALQADGKIVVAGTVAGASNQDVLVLRFNPDGTLDGSFDTDGAATYDGGFSDGGRGIAVQADYKIVVVARSGNGSDDDMLILRYAADGTLDGTFGVGGVVTYDNGGTDRAWRVAIQPDDKILVVGHSSNGSDSDAVLLRYEPDGLLDGTFGTGGVARYDSGNTDRGFDLAIQTDDKILVVGESADDALLLRYTSIGTPDDTFGSGGGVTYDHGGFEYVDSVEIQADAKIVVSGGSTATPSDNDVIVLRYDANGVLDGSFAADGVGTYDFGALEFGYGSAIQSDGKIVVTGEREGPGFTHEALTMRLIGLTAALGGIVWNDADRDGIRDAGEAGVEGIDVALYENGACTDAASLSTSTDPSGSYGFTALDTGTYCVQFSNLPAGWVISPPDQGADDTIDSDADPSTGKIANIALVTDALHEDMGIYAPPGTITITKDADVADGTRFEFTGAGGDFQLADGEAQEFAELDQGTYPVTELDPFTSSFALTALACADPDGGTTVDLATRTAMIDLDPGENVECTFTNTYRTPAEQTAMLIEAVAQLSLDGVLKPGQARGLITPLENVLRSLDKEKLDAACSQLADFVDKVEEKISDGALPEAEGQSLIEWAHSIVTHIGC